VQVGLKLFAELFPPQDLVRQAVLAEEAGFDFVEMSDHFHPWFEKPNKSPHEGHSGFAWSTLGMVAARTTKLRLGTGVTCPSFRYHPAIIAQAAATMQILSEGRFFLGIGSGERLNEHIVGKGWHSAKVRLEFMAEAMEIIRMLWSGGFHSFEGKHLTLEDARIYDLPKTLPPVIIAAAGPAAARIAAKFGDGLFTTSPAANVVQAFTDAGGWGDKIGEMVTGFARTEEIGLKAATASVRWGIFGTPTDSELPRASDFIAASQFVRPSDLATIVAAGPDPSKYLALAQQYADAGLSSIALLGVGPDMDAFFPFAADHLIKQIRAIRPSTQADQAGPAGNSEMVSIPRGELDMLRAEVRRLRHEVG
jgi:G6PDH family F420-dependent oxidoreductase